MIKAVLFDYGGVISDGGTPESLPDRLAGKLGVSSDEAYRLLGDVWAAFSRGNIDEEAAWQIIERVHGSPIAKDKRAIWNTWEVMQPRPELLDYVSQLRARDIVTGLLSNVVPPTLEEIKQHGVYDSFDFTVLSCEVGFAKPDIEIYRIALQHLAAIRSDEVIFVDDVDAFLEPARSLGIKTIHATSATHMLDEINRLIDASA